MTPVDESQLLDVARQAAQAAAAELRSRFGERAQDVQVKSSPTDLVSAADVAAEAAIRDVLGRRRPGDAILGEEGGSTGEGELRWVVDPLDGTSNYLLGIPVFAVSVACENAHGPLVGVVLDPVSGECFSATRSGPPMRDGDVIYASGRSDLSTSMVATGFSYSAEVRSRQAQTLTRVLPRVRDIRRAGAAALDLCWCACGRLDAYFERGVHNWDVAAGRLIAERAGLASRELAESAEDPWGLVVAPPAILDELYALVT